MAKSLFFIARDLATSGKIVVSSLRPRFWVWLPIYRETDFSTLGSLFQLPTLLGFPLQSFSPFQGSKNSFEFIFRSCAFLQDRLGLESTLQRFDPPEKAALLASQNVNLGRKLGSLGSSDLSGILFDEPRKDLFPLFSTLLFFSPLASYESKRNETSGLFSHQLGISHKGRQPVWPFPPTAFPPFSGPDEQRAIFSP